MRFAAIINPGASTVKDVDRDWLEETLLTKFAEGGHDVSINFAVGSSMISAMKAAVKDDGVEGVIAGGGDGTISAAAGILSNTGKPLAVLPAGNMNLFARSLGVPLDTEAAIAALAHGRRGKADIAYANDRPFIHEFSLGLHPEMIEQRDKQKYGSRMAKLMGSMRSLYNVIMRPPRVRVWLNDGEGRERAIATPALVVSNNVFGEGHLPYADRVDGGELGVYIARSSRSADLAAVTARLPLGSWADLPHMEFFTAEKLKLSRKRRLKIAIDGELVMMDTPVEIRIAPGALDLIIPTEEHALRGQ